MSDGTPDADEIYPCVGICWPDPERDCCMGCGRPLTSPPAAAQPSVPASVPAPVVPDEAEPA